MAQLVSVRSADPCRFDVLYKLGEDLVNFASTGKLQKLTSFVNKADTADLNFYFIIKMFHGALVNGHLMIASFMIDHGYPLTCASVPNALIESLSVVDDRSAIPIIELLVLTHKCDVNFQVNSFYDAAPSRFSKDLQFYPITQQTNKTWMTPLHVAVRRGLIRTIVFLIKNGADVNAVAEGDCMPLTLAEGLEASNPEKDEIIDVLLKRYLMR